ncbi:MAG: VOC family protein [Nitritalea sp.]
MKKTNIAHVALWAIDLEKMRTFYETYLGFQAGKKYVNSQKGFSSYFLTSAGSCRIELMHSTFMEKPQAPNHKIQAGLAHIAFSLGSAHAVKLLSQRLKEDGYTHLDGPRMTGDGYFESTFLDPEGNTIELTI